MYNHDRSGYGYGYRSLIYGLNEDGELDKPKNGTIDKNGVLVLVKKGISIFPEINQKKVVGVVALIRSQMYWAEKRVFALERVTKVTALHIAAREAQYTVCAILIGRHAFRNAKDSSEATPENYLCRAHEGWKDAGGYGYDGEKYDFKNVQEVPQLKILLKYSPQIPKSLPLPYTILHNKEFSIVYDTRTKVPCYVYACITKDMLIKIAAIKEGMDIPLQFLAKQSKACKSRINIRMFFLKILP